MNKTTLNEADALVRYSRRGLWITLALISLLGAWAVASIGFPDSEAAAFARRLSLLLPIFIVIAAAALKSSARGARTDPSGPAMKAMLNDELRLASLNRAYRNGFFGVMAAQPVLALAPTWIAVAHPVSMMACLTAVIGVVVVVASMLYHDR
jgi:hypothetical protein